MKKALCQLALENNLPPVQHMDRETLNWIVANRPNLPGCKLLRKELVLESTKRFLPARDWFLTNELYDSIHGIRHIGRVIANAAHLAINRGINENTTQNLMIACATHDLSRIDDMGDLGHGDRASKWFEENKRLVEEKYGAVISEKDTQAITTAIRLHETPYAIIEGSDEYLSHRDLVDLIKTADALDRYRLPKIKWWINEDLLTLKPSPEEKSVAFEMLTACENEYLNTSDSQNSVIRGLSKL